MRPTPRAVYVAILGGVFALLPVLFHARLWTFWPLFLGWLGLVLGIDVWLAPRLRRVRCEATCPETLYVGRREKALLVVNVGSGGIRAIEVLAELSSDLEAPSVLRQAGRGPEFHLEAPLVPQRRGTARLEAAWVRYQGPLGLMRLSRRLPLGVDMPVMPDSPAVQSLALKFFSDREYRVGMKVERFRGDGTEFDSLREFLHGDDNRTIDWKSSARHKKLVSRLFRAERNHQVIVAVDTGHLMVETLSGIPKLDHALNAALLLSYVGLKNGDRVGFFTFDAKVGLFSEPQAGMRAHASITHLASRVEYSAAETNFTLGLATLMQRVRRRSLIIVLTDFVDTIGAELMLGNLGRLAKRHLVIFVSLRDPELTHVATAAPSAPLQLNSAVVAQTLIQDRETVLRRLRRLGILSIDAEPSQVGAELINSYLEIKRREMI